MSAHILVVEDDDTMRTALTTWLRHAGYQVTHAADGESALNLLPTHAFDIIITDLIMGRVNGIDVLQAAVAQPYRPEVILLTGHGSLDTSLTALRSRAYDYLLKPCTADEVLACVNGAMQRRSNDQQMREALDKLMSAVGLYRADPTAKPSDSLPVGEYRLRPPMSHNPSPSLPHQSPMIYRIGDLLVGPSRHEVSFNGRPVHTTPTEYALLRYLAEHNGTVCRCRDIVRHTHGVETNDGDAQALLRSHIHNLRKKVSPSYFVNDRGTGYMLVNPDQQNY